MKETGSQRLSGFPKALLLIITRVGVQSSSVCPQSPQSPCSTLASPPHVFLAGLLFWEFQEINHLHRELSASLNKSVIFIPVSLACHA